VCNQHAIENNSGGSFEILDAKIAEYSKAVVDGRPNFHISIVNNVSPNCDCHNESDMAVVPDIGMFASFDPVALDAACIAAVNAAQPYEQSWWGDQKPTHEHDPFLDIHTDATWKPQLEHGEKIGLGTSKYELVKI
jgi:uncharacterized Fe-S center protein